MVWLADSCSPSVLSLFIYSSSYPLLLLLLLLFSYNSLTPPSPPPSLFLLLLLYIYIYISLPSPSSFTTLTFPLSLTYSFPHSTWLIHTKFFYFIQNAASSQFFPLFFLSSCVILYPHFLNPIQNRIFPLPPFICCSVFPPSLLLFLFSYFSS